jgi:uncharacterized membrane protein YfcA
MKNKFTPIYHNLRQKITKRQMSVFILAVILIISYPGAVFASYIYDQVMNNYTATADAEFYFTSDLLGADLSAIPTYYLCNDWQSAATITFKLRNYDSTLNISDSNISYSVTATASGGSASGTIAAGGSPGNEATINLTIPASADQNSPLSVTVTAVSTSPYAKTLKGIFVIKPAVSYAIDSNAGSPLARLTVTLEEDSSATQTRAVTINWPAGASPDMTNPMVINATSINLTTRTMTTTVNKAAVYELIFFKDSVTANYTGVTVT